MPIDKIKILYYSTAYGATHGGSTHARAFVENCKQADTLVSDIRVFPDVKQKGHVNTPSLRKFAKTRMLLPFRFARRNRFHLNDIKKVIREFQPDVVHIRLDSNFLQIKKLKEAFPKVIVTAEVNASPFDESFKGIPFEHFFRKLERNYLSASDLNFFVSERLRSRIMTNEVHPARDFVVQNGVDISLFRRKAEFSKRGYNKTVIYIGTLDRHKRIDMLLGGFRIAIEKYPELRLVIVGDGPDRVMLEEMSRRYGLSESVVFTGRVSHEKIPAYLENADIAIHPYANDYMSPLKLFEYMAMELPVIGPDTQAVREVFTDEKNIMLTSGTVEDIARKIELFVSDKELQTRISRAGYNLVTTRFTWEANVLFILGKMLDKLNDKSHIL